MRDTPVPCQKAPSAKRCIKTCSSSRSTSSHSPPCQKALSAKRCIKTRCRSSPTMRRGTRVRKRRAPKGALRQRCLNRVVTPVSCVRKHRAPKGALRQSAFVCGNGVVARQKAPSAKRCIETHVHVEHVAEFDLRQKAPSAKRCIKTCKRSQSSDCRSDVSKHRAPNDALKLVPYHRQR